MREKFIAIQVFKFVLLLVCFSFLSLELSAQATLPINRTNWDVTPTGWTDNAGGTYLTSFACSNSNGGKFATTGDNYQVFFNSSPDVLTYTVKLTSNGANAVLVEESVDGTVWTTVANDNALTTTCDPYTHNLNSASRYVRWTYTKVSNATIDDVNITAGISCSTPTVQASNITFPSIGLNTMTISWTNGNGTGRIVKMNTVNTFTDPVDLNSYTANSLYSGGEQVIFNGTGNTVNVTGLTPNTQYFVKIYEYDCTGASSLYLVPSTATSNSTTLDYCSNATVQASNIVFSSILATSVNVSWTNGNGNYRIVVAKQGSAVTGTPANGTTYTASSAFGAGSTIAANEFVVYKGAGNSVTVTGLTELTNYHFKVFEFCAPTGNGSENYLIASAPANNTTTITNMPSTCFEIESILVDACARYSLNYQEGPNEMVRFRVGATALDVANMTVSWATANLWRGIVQNAMTAAITAYLNATIQSCGHLIEPAGGILPAGANVLLITSSDTLIGATRYFDLAGNSFAYLSDTLYVIYQQSHSSNIGGHFSNYSSTGTRNFSITFSSPGGCTDAVSYDCDLYPDNDGDRVDYAWDNTPTYVNDGCQAPFEPAGVTAINASGINHICIGENLSLDGTAVGSYTNLYWSGGTGTFSSPNTLATTYTPGINESGIVTLYLNAESGSCGSVNDTVMVNIHQPPTPTISNDTTICDGATVNLTAGGGFTYAWSNSLPSTATVSVSPSSQTTYSVTVTSVYGCKSDTSVTVNVNALPNVTASSDATNDNICNGDTIVLTGAGASTYIWNNGVNNGNPFSPLTTTTYTVTGTDANGCKNTDQITITVNNPTANAGSNQSIYTNTSTNLTGSASNGSGNYSYSWIPANLLVDPNVQNPTTINLTNTTTFTLTIHDNTTGCNDTAQVTIEVTGGNLSITTIANTSICIGDSIILTTLPSGGTGGNTYSWSSVPPGFTSTEQSPYVNPSIATTYTVTVTDAGSITASASTTITINQLPNVTASSNDADNTICNGSQITLNGGGASIYVWDNSASNGVALTPPLGTTTYTVTGTDGNGCKNTSQITVTVNALPIVNVNASNTSICKGEPVTLSGSGTSGNSYSWSNSVSNGVSFVPTATQTYTVTATGSNTCVNTAQITVTVNPKPTLTYTTVQAGCGMSNGSATITASGGTGTYTYLWDTNAGSQATSTATSLGVGAYSVTVTDANCSKDTTINISELGAPTVSITYSDNDICNGEAVTITASGATSYSWNSGQNTAQIVVSPTTTTTYSVTGTTTGCSGSSSTTINVHDKPTVTATSDDADNTICEGEQITLSGNGASSYTWSDLSITTNVPFSPLAGNYTYTVTGTDLNYCSNTNTITITVNPKPNLSISASGDNVCEGTSVTITATGATSYSCDNGGSVNFAFIPPIGINLYTITGVDVATGCSKTLQTTVIVSQKPTVELGTPYPICKGDSVTLLAGPPTGYTYLWSTNETTSTIHVFDPGNYSVSVSNSCPDIVTDNVDIVVNDLPIINLPTDTTNADGNMTVVLNAGDFSDYVWSTSAITQSLEVSSSGTYYVTVTDANGCKSSKAVVVTISDFVIHPYNTITPNGDQVNDKWRIDNIEFFPKSEVKIFNRSGNKVFETTRYNNEKNYWDGKYNNKDLPAATYYYIIDLGDGSKIYKGFVSIVR